MGVEDEIRKIVRAEISREVERLRKESGRGGRASVCAVCGHDGARHEALEIVPGYEPTWTTKQVAAFLGIRPKTVYNRLAGREVGFPRPRKRGSLNAFVPSEVAEYRMQRLGF